MSKSEENRCPLFITERRLNDSLELWIETKKKYFDPKYFRIYLNNLIQSLRNLTWILQSSKSKFPLFDNWYKQWQDKMRADAVLKWLIEARNIIVKEGDLKTYSKVRVAIVNSWFDPPSKEFEVAPFVKTENIARTIAQQKLKNRISKVGLLRVERRWVDSKLPEHELLEAVSHVYKFLFKILVDGHINLIDEKFTSDCFWYSNRNLVKEEFTEIMAAQEWDRTIWLDLSDGEVLKPDSIEIPAINDNKIKKRYPFLKDFIRKEKIESFEEEAKYWFDYSKNILSADGYHDCIVFLGYPNGSVKIMQLGMQDRTEKYLMFRKLATQVEKTGANSVIIIIKSFIA